MYNKKLYVLGWVILAGMLLGTSLCMGGVGGPNSVAFAVPVAETAITPPPSPTPTFSPRRIVPGQFIAKMYTEAFGRAPSQAEWEMVAIRLQYDGCHTTAVSDIIREFYTSGEFTSLYDDKAARLLALYRGALNRDPDELDSSTFEYYLGLPGAWEALVDDFLVQYTPEIQSLAADFCYPGQFYLGAPYYWDTNSDPEMHLLAPPIDCNGEDWVFYGRACGEDEDDALQEMLYKAKDEGQATVYLAQKALVEFDGVWDPNLEEYGPIYIPSGITLMTQGFDDPSLGHQNYALMGRVVRRSPSGRRSHILVLQRGSTLQGVWVDGQYNWNYEEHGGRIENAAEVAIKNWGGAAPVQVFDCRLSDSASFTPLQAFGDFEGEPCPPNVHLHHNLITNYATNHYPFGKNEDPQWSDGISTACENTIVEYNQVVDATDVGIVVYRSAIDTHQQSRVSYNTVLNAGNSAYAAYGVNHLSWKNEGDPEPGSMFSFIGTEISDNVLWTSQTAHIDIPLTVGSRAWYSAKEAYIGQRADFHGNKTDDGSLLPPRTPTPGFPRQPMVRGNSPILVSGMLHAIVYDNFLNVIVRKTSSCPAPSTPGMLILSTCPDEASFCSDPPPTCPPVPDFEPVPISMVGQCIGKHYYAIMLPLALKNYATGGTLMPPAPPEGYPLPSPPLPLTPIPTPMESGFPAYPLPMPTPGS